jgi:hypothetical protein
MTSTRYPSPKEKVQGVFRDALTFSSSLINMNVNRKGLNHKKKQNL